MNYKTNCLLAALAEILFQSKDINNDEICLCILEENTIKNSSVANIE